VCSGNTASLCTPQSAGAAVDKGAAAAACAAPWCRLSCVPPGPPGCAATWPYCRQIRASAGACVRACETSAGGPAADGGRRRAGAGSSWRACARRGRTSSPYAGGNSMRVPCGHSLMLSRPRPRPRRCPRPNPRPRPRPHPRTFSCPLSAPSLYHRPLSRVRRLRSHAAAGRHTHPPGASSLAGHLYLLPAYPPSASRRAYPAAASLARPHAADAAAACPGPQYGHTQLMVMAARV
jgi:hypothetical protein